MFRFRRVVIKVGSSVLTRSDGTLNVERMQTLVHQIAELHKDGVDIILVTSGAVASGRSVLKPEKIINSTTNRQMYAAVGQAKLINYYYEMFLEHGIFCGQILTTKEDFDHRLLYLNLKNCLSAMLEHKVIPIVNENDTVAITELMFTDNDELAGLMSTMMDTEVLIILSVIDGLFAGSLSDPTSSVIRQIEPGTNIFSFVHDHKSSHGTGGMHSKASAARKVAAEGIPVIIANGTRDNIIIDLLKPGADVISTLFLPNSTTNVPDNSSWRESALEAARHLNLISDEQIKLTLLAIADEAVAKTDIILAANSKDVDAMDPSNPMRDRLLLTPTRIADIAKDIRKVASLSSPLAKTLEQRTLPNGLNLSKLSVPFGVIGVIYEARPNVSFDVFSLCFKSGNVCVLKGGTDAYNSNRAIVDLIQDVLDRSKINRNVIHLLPAGRIATADLLNAVGVVDVIIPRGSAGLINYVRDTSRVPVIETGAGVCHTYFDEFGDREKGASIINNAKTRRVSVCNALDCLVIHESRLSDLSYLCENLSESKVVIEADEGSYSFLSGKYPFLEKVNDKSYGTEFLSYRMSIKTVSSIQEAIQFITTHSSKHSEAIISQSRENIAIFTKQIDAACVYSNASTAFTDGAQFGMGAEIGISTQKLHARGPMALMELTSYKWIIEGDGQTRPK